MAKAALVTGVSNGGVGLATARLLAERGYITYATARQPEKLGNLPGLHTLGLDVTDESSMAAAVAAVEREHGAVDVLVNNAAYGEMGAVEEVPLERMRLQFETNVFGMMRMCQLVLAGMRRKGWGRIVNVSSMGGEFTTPFAGWYHASKYAVESLSDALRMEVYPFGVDVIVIQPGGINTPLAQRTIDALRTTVGSPYREAMESFRGVSAAMMAQHPELLSAPEAIGRVIVEAVESEQPLTRYKVGTPDDDQVNATRDSADRQRDATFRQQYGLPSR